MRLQLSDSHSVSAWQIVPSSCVFNVDFLWL